MTTGTRDHSGHGTSTEYGERWQDRAACRGMADKDANVFFPEEIRGLIKRHAVEEQLVAICLTCPVAQQCLDDAERVGDKWGVRGGYAMDERGWKTR
jgi:WhiB family redox-sensing transcriptional regulator